MTWMNTSKFNSYYLLNGEVEADLLFHFFFTAWNFLYFQIFYNDYVLYV